MRVVAILFAIEIATPMIMANQVQHEEQLFIEIAAWHKMCLRLKQYSLWSGLCCKHSKIWRVVGCIHSSGAIGFEIGRGLLTRPPTGAEEIEFSMGLYKERRACTG